MTAFRRQFGVIRCNVGLHTESHHFTNWVMALCHYLIVALAASQCLIYPLMSSAQVQANEYRLKAALLFHFAEFVEWPTAGRGDTEDPFLICVVGDDPFHGDLEQTVRGKFIAAKMVVTRHIKQPQEGYACHLVFIGTNESDRVSQFIATVRHMPVLTVGESDDFLQKGGIIRFCIDERKVRFEVNQEAAENAHLKISSRLLLLAKTVIGPNSRR